MNFSIGIGKMNLSILLILLVFYIEISHCNNAWLNMCMKDGSKYYIFEPNHCEEGIFFRKPIQPTCVCARGVWMFKRDICDPKGKIGYLIAANDEKTCFAWNPGSAIRYMRYLGNPYNWNEPTAYIADKDYSKIEMLGGVGSTSQSGYANVILINPQADQAEIRDCGDTTCFAPKTQPFEVRCPEPGCELSWIGGTAVAMRPIDNRTGYWFNTEQTPEDCEVKVDEDGTKAKFKHDRNFTRIGWGGAYVGAPYGDSIAGRCKISCEVPEINFEGLPPVNGAVFIDKDGNVHPLPTPTGPTVPPGPTTTTGTTQPPTTTTPKPRIYLHLDPKNPEIIDPGFNYPPNCSSVPKIKYPPLSKRQQNEINEQSLRMMRLNYEVVLTGQRTPQVNITEYELFQTSRLILEKVCPQQEVPKTLLRSFLRMFRMALNETQLKYPYLLFADPDSLGRIQKSLATCLSIKPEKQFKFQYTECPRTYNYTNITDVPVNATMPCELSFNTTKYDYVAEVAWKTVMFVHYYCAEYFDTTNYDHSRLQFVLHKLFNRNIMHRWFQQGKSAQLFEYMFRTYDLKAFKEGLDHCVAGARSVSPYKKWIRRPSYEKECELLKEEEGEARKKADPSTPAGRAAVGITKSSLVFDGQALCLKTHENMAWTGGSCFPTLSQAQCYDFRVTPSTSTTTTTTTTTKKPHLERKVQKEEIPNICERRKMIADKKIRSGWKMCAIWPGYDFEPTSDPLVLKKPNQGKCCEECAKRQECLGWVYGHKDKHCYIKYTRILEKSPKSGYTSGLVLDSNEEPHIDAEIVNPLTGDEKITYPCENRIPGQYATCSVSKGLIGDEYNMSGGDSGSLGKCCWSCKNTNGCVAWTYWKGQCRLKSGTQFKEKGEKGLSGILLAT